MTQFDIQYRRLIDNILNDGKWDKEHDVRARWSDGTPAYTISLLNEKLEFDNSKELPILTTKQMPWKTPIIEVPFWMWRDKSNVVDDLRKLNGTKKTVWDEWERPDGTIGKSYGYQLGKKCRLLNRKKVDQVDYLIHGLKHDKGSRRHLVTLWNINDLDDMSLPPCVYETRWQIWGGALHVTVKIRSSDVGLGLPFNVYQYSVLHRMIAQVTNNPVGTITFNLDNPHIYDRHIEKLEEQIGRKPLPAPELLINPFVENFYDFTMDDFHLGNYQAHDKIFLPVAE